jgi:hypothetical protein
MLVPISALLAVAVQVTNAQVDVSVASEGVTVTAEYTFAEGGAEVKLQAIRLPAVALTVLSSSVPLERTEDEGSTRWRALRESDVLSVAWRLDGAGDRIPLIIPMQSTLPGEANVQIRIRGLSPDVFLVDGFPRMMPGDDGVVVATPANLPSLLLLPHSRSVSLARTSDLLVLVLLVLSSSFWLVWRTRRVR